MNGDVVFDPAVLEHVLSYVRADESFVCVDTAPSPTRRSSTPSTRTATSGSCPRPSSAGSARPSASTTSPADDKAALIEHLDACGDQDYFERAIETAIELEGLRFRPLDISAFAAVEVDFETDLERANALLCPARC